MVEALQPVVRVFEPLRRASGEHGLAQQDDELVQRDEMPHRAALLLGRA